MTLLLREVGRFLLGAGAWSIVAVAIAALVAVPTLWFAKHRLRWQTVAIAAVAGTVAAATAHRLSIPLWSPEIGGRPLPAIWVVAGAAVATVVIVLRHRPDPQ